MRKFELTTDTKMRFGKKLFRIKALIDFGNVKAGEKGGYIEKEENLSQCGNAWVYGDAEVCGNAKVYGNAEVCGNAEVYGDAEVYGNAWVCGNAEVCGNAWVYGNADYATAKGFGSEYRTTTFFKLKDSNEIGVRCGCFYGTLKEFKEKVKETHGETKKAKEYLILADLMEYRFSEEKKA